MNRGSSFIFFIFSAFLVFQPEIPVRAGEIYLRSGILDLKREPGADIRALEQSAGPGNKALVLIRYIGPIQPEWIDTTRALGVEFHFYVPDFSYLVEISPDLLNHLKKLEYVEWIGLFSARNKVHPDLQRQMVSGKEEAEIDIRILSVNRSAGSFLSVLGMPTSVPRKTPAGWYETRVRSRGPNIAEIAQWPGVFHIETAPEYEMFGERGAQTAAGNYLPGGTAPLGPGYMDWLSGHGLAGGPGLVVQIQDDGLDRGIASGEPGSAHPDLLGRIVGVFNATNDSSGDSRAGHGTINAGIIAGNAVLGATDQDGYLLGQGLAPLATLYGTKVFRNNGDWGADAHSFSSLAARAQEAGCLFSNNSWGSRTAGEYNSDSAIFDALARDCNPNLPGNQPMTYFFSSGNSGPNAKTIGSPATAKNVIAVGASENSDSDGTDGCGVGPQGANSIRDLINFSSRGPTTDGRFGITVVAVGTHVQGPASTGADYDGTGVCDKYWPLGQTDYARSSGTSHSCPIACGAGMVIYELFQSYLGVLGTGHPENPSPALIKAVLAATATDLAGGSDGSGGILAPAPNPEQGFGSVNLSSLLDMKDSLYSYDQTHLFTSSGESWSRLIWAVDPSKPLKIVLTWTDPPAMPGAGVTLVNDLDLEVEGADGTFFGNSFENGYSIPGGDPDRRNNIEAVFIENPGSFYEIRVNAYNIAGRGVPGETPLLNQDFALFVWNGKQKSDQGAVRFGRRATNCQDEVPIYLVDAGLSGTGSVEVTVASESGDVETLTLFESDPESGILKGILLTSSGVSLPEDGLLQVQHEDTITVTYHDSDDGTGSPAVVSDAISVDCVPPGILLFGAEDLTSEAVTLFLDTDKPARATFHLGYAFGIAEATGVSQTRTSHRVRFGGLSGCTLYHYWAVLEDYAGNVTVSDGGNGMHRLVTPQFAQKFREDFDPVPSSGWIHSASVGRDAWHPTDSEYAHSGVGIYAYRPGADFVSDARLVSPEFPGGSQLTFWHTYEFEKGYDGALLEISTNGGETWMDLGPHIVEGGYTGGISNNYQSPIGGRDAWTGGIFGPMTRVKVDLRSFTGPFRVAFRVASDRSIASGGWLIDSILAGDEENCLSNMGSVILVESAIGCSRVLHVEVLDLSPQQPVVTVLLTTQAGDAETLTLTDAGSAQFFRGSILTGTPGDSVVQEDGSLQGNLLDVITAYYEDPDDGTGSPQTAISQSILDCIAPIVSEVQLETIDSQEAILSFTTDEKATVVVRYGLDCGNLLLSTWGPEETSHRIILKSLIPDSVHYFLIEATDAAGNVAVAGENGNCYSFSTPYQRDYFTEIFQNQDNDLNNQTLWFTPDGSRDFYSVCRQVTESYPTDPEGGTVLSLGDDESRRVLLAGDIRVSLYGVEYDHVWVSSNGYLTFGGGDTQFSESLERHFSLPRVAGLFDDLDPTRGGTISWKQLSDRLAVTYDNIREYGTSSPNRFQMEMFFDGRITLTHLQISALDGLAGLSEGAGLPVSFYESDLSGYSPCPDPPKTPTPTPTPEVTPEYTPTFTPLPIPTLSVSEIAFTFGLRWGQAIPPDDPLNQSGSNRLDATNLFYFLLNPRGEEAPFTTPTPSDPGPLEYRIIQTPNGFPSGR